MKLKYRPINKFELAIIYAIRGSSYYSSTPRPAGRYIRLCWEDEDICDYLDELKDEYSFKSSTVKKKDFYDSVFKEFTK